MTAAGQVRPAWLRSFVALPLVWVLAASSSGCTATSSTEIATLRRRPALEYSVWMTGGAFVRKPPALADGEERDPYERTFDLPLDAEEVVLDDGIVVAAPAASIVFEAIRLESLQRVLDSAEVFVRLEKDERSVGQRAEQSGRFDESLLQQVRDSGHDLMLVVRPLEDGPIEDQGINDRWPVTLLTWLGLGLGMVIPDRTYESRAALQVALVDPWSGDELFAEALGSGPVELALVDRASFFGVVQSIIVPPFWVASSRKRVESRVRRESERRMAIGLARRLKRVVTEEQIRGRRPVWFDVTPVGDARLRVFVQAREALSFVVAQRDGVPIEDPAFVAFQDSLLQSRRPLEPTPGAAAGPTGFRYEAVWDVGESLGDGAELLQFLAQTVAGRVGSVTLRIQDL